MPCRLTITHRSTVAAAAAVCLGAALLGSAAPASAADAD
ncbi:serine protease, partial [Clavibacter michiganensis]